MSQTGLRPPNSETADFRPCLGPLRIRALMGQEVSAVQYRASGSRLRSHIGCAAQGSPDLDRLSNLKLRSATLYHCSLRLFVNLGALSRTADSPMPKLYC